jgi:catechol 2,3-dioxygenase-like lactoylglutathione lyase family enzyme
MNGAKAFGLHFSIYVNSMDRALDFYKNLVGLSVVNDITIGSGDRFIDLGFATENKIGVFLQLIESANLSDKRYEALLRKRLSFSLSFDVDDLQDEVDRLAKLDISPESVVIEKGYEYALFRDPDGIPVTMQRIWLK